MALAFSSGDSILHHQVAEQLQRPATSSPCDEEKYPLEKCAEWINHSKFDKVALQFPDELLCDCHYVVKELKKRTSAELCVTADTSYGSCCADEVAAEHYGASAVLHFGPACLSPTVCLPVLYVFPKVLLDTAACVRTVSTALEPVTSETCATPIILLTQQSYYYCYDELLSTLKERIPTVIPCRPFVQENVNLHMAGHSPSIMKNMKHHGRSEEEHLGNPSIVSTAPSPQGNIESHQFSLFTEKVDLQHEEKQGRSQTETSSGMDCNINQQGKVFKCCGHEVCILNDLNLEDAVLVYVGKQDQRLTTFIMTWGIKRTVVYNPESATAELSFTNQNRLVMKRYYLVEKIKDANIIGLLVGTLAVRDHIEILKRLKSLLAKAGRRYYTIVVGKLNVAKLANFAEVDVYVLVSCPMNSLLDKGDFYQPIVTPHEMELALNPAAQWEGGVNPDFRQLLEGGSTYTPLPDSDIAEGADISLVTGEIRRMGVSDVLVPAPHTHATDVVQRNTSMHVALQEGSGADFLSQRSWRGLEQKLGETPVTMATEGSKGVASGYQNEPATH